MSKQGNPYSSIETVLCHQGPLDHILPTPYHTDVFSTKNADKMVFFITILNVQAEIRLDWVYSNGIFLETNVGTPVGSVDVLPTINSPFSAGRRVLQYVLPPPNPLSEPRESTMPDYARFFVLRGSYNAVDPYVPPPPVPTGVANLHNSALSIKDENAPLFKIDVLLINPKP